LGRIWGFTLGRRKWNITRHDPPSDFVNKNLQCHHTYSCVSERDRNTTCFPIRGGKREDAVRKVLQMIIKNRKLLKQEKVSIQFLSKMRERVLGELG